MELGKEETTWGAVRVLRLCIENYGVPLALYTDWKNVYKVAPAPQQELLENSIRRRRWKMLRPFRFH
jgi:hypothetical protein